MSCERLHHSGLLVIRRPSPVGPSRHRICSATVGPSRGSCCLSQASLLITCAHVSSAGACTCLECRSSHSLSKARCSKNTSSRASRSAFSSARRNDARALAAAPPDIGDAPTSRCRRCKIVKKKARHLHLSSNHRAHISGTRILFFQHKLAGDPFNPTSHSSDQPIKLRTSHKTSTSHSRKFQ